MPTERNARALLHDAFCRFWRRDYMDDVALLNAELRAPGADSAGLAEMPPSILTGDPFALTAGECVVVIGKNPSFPGQTGDLAAAIAEHASGSYEDYVHRRSLYFADHDPLGQYNWRHFSRLGNLLREHVPIVRGNSPREAFRNSVAVFDLLPWWSRNTRSIHQSRLAGNIEPLRHWQELLREVIQVLSPRLIVVHGTGFRDLAATILDTQFERFDFGSPNGYRGVGYSGRLHSGTPVLAHAQVTAQGGPGTSDAYGALIRAFSYATEFDR